MARKVEVLGFWTAFASAGSGGDVGETAVVELGAVVGLWMFPYAREAVAMLLDQGFSSVGLERVIAQTARG